MFGSRLIIECPVQGESIGISGNTCVFEGFEFLLLIGRERRTLPSELKGGMARVVNPLC